MLLVDDESSVLTTTRRCLEHAGWTVICAKSAGEALRITQSVGFSVAVVDYRLRGRAEGIRLGRALQKRRGIPFLLMSGYLDTSVVVDAMKAGALDVIDKPFTQSRLVSLLAEAASRTPDRTGENADAINIAVNINDEGIGESQSITARWARMVLKACEAREDPRTVPLWGRVIGASASTIEATCRLCGVTALDSRDLGRFLRTLSRNRTSNTQLRSDFAVADERTLRGLFKRASLAWDAQAVPLRVFFARQHFVEASNPCLRELARLAANSPLFS